MQRQPVLADIDAIDEAGLHHVPADGALHPAEHQQSELAAAAMSAPRQRKDEGQRDATPMKRPRNLWPHSHQ